MESNGKVDSNEMETGGYGRGNVSAGPKNSNPLYKDHPKSTRFWETKKKVML